MQFQKDDVLSVATETRGTIYGQPVGAEADQLEGPRKRQYNLPGNSWNYI